MRPALPSSPAAGTPNGKSGEGSPIVKRPGCAAWPCKNRQEALSASTAITSRVSRDVGITSRPDSSCPSHRPDSASARTPQVIIFSEGCEPNGRRGHLNCPRRKFDSCEFLLRSRKPDRSPSNDRVTAYRKPCDLEAGAIALKRRTPLHRSLHRIGQSGLLFS
jgi:hypothetical protein